MNSIRGRLTVFLVVGFAALLAACGSAIYAITGAALYRGFDEALKAKAMLVAAQVEQTSDGIQLEPSAALAQQFNNLAPQYYQLSQTNGAALARSDSLGDEVIPLRAGLKTEPMFWNEKLLPGGPGRAIGFKFQPKFEDERGTNQMIKEAALMVAADRRDLDQTLATLASVLGVTGILALAVTAPLVRAAVRRGHAPLAALAGQAAGINAESLQERFPVATLPEELRPISARFNDLLARLERSFARERRFSADLAHELRTPLAELRAQAEVGLQFAAGEAREAHQDSFAIALQMESIVARLLELSRCENGQISLLTQRVGLRELVDQVWRPFAAEAAAKQLAVQIDVLAAAELRTDPPLLRSILVNLISNAVTYTPVNGRVSVSWRPETAALVVSNTVSDLEPQDLPYLFERLWRKDKSRTGTEHLGLGLALSRTYADVLGLKLTAGFAEPKTLELVLGKV